MDLTWANFWTTSIAVRRDLPQTSVSLTRGGPLMRRGPGATMGVSLGNSWRGDGARVGDLSAGGGAEQAGIQTGDVIVEIDGKPVADSTELVVTVRAKAPGDTITVTVQRNGQSVDIPVTLGSTTS